MADRVPPVRPDKPVRRRNPSGRIVWIARYTGPDGRRRIAKPEWNRNKGTFTRERDAQRAIADAIEEAYRLRGDPEALGEYADTWTTRRPRSERTNATNDHRLGRVLDVEISGRPLRDWPYADLRRKHAHELVDHLLRVQRRAPTGVTGILRTLSAMTEDAIDDEIAEVNAFRGVKVRANDPRATKKRRPTRVFSFEAMHRFAAAAGRREAMVRMFPDTGMRLAEVLALERVDWDPRRLTFQVKQTAHEGVILPGTKTDHGEEDAGRVVPCPPSLAALINAMPRRIDSPFLFPTPTGLLWRERNFYRDVWYPTQQASGLDIRPHECRHSYISHLRARKVDDADLAAMAGHTVETMIGHYTHALNESFDQVRDVIG